MRTSIFLASILITTIASLGCDDPNGEPQPDTGESGENGENGESETGTETGDVCEEPVPADVIDHDVRFSGFPELDGDVILDSNTFTYEGDCTVLSAGPVGDTNEVVFACEHTDSDAAQVTLTLDGVALPAGLEVDESVELRVSSAVNVGGLVDELDIESGGPKPRMLMAGFQDYEIRDSDGLVFAAMHGLSGLDSDYVELTVELADSCPTYEFGDPDVAAFFRATTDDASIDVAVGETKTVALGDRAWDVRTFRAQRSCCHGDLGDVRVLRTAL